MQHQVKKNLGVTGHGESTQFRLWAPFATSVTLAGTVNDGQRVDMASEGDGYWSVSIKGVVPGQNYVYLITTPDGRTLTRNDPRAQQLTTSDSGASVIVDPNFDWQGDDFSPVPPKQQVIYELHIGTFNRPDAATIGTFEDAIDKLDYLKGLGVNVVELMPVTSMAHGYGWGYAPNHIFSVENAYGGRHGLLTFVRECHKQGIAVILDVVYNHFSGKTDLWQFDGWSENQRGGIYFYNDSRGDTPWGGRPDYGRPEVRQFFLDNAAMWLNEYHLDGLRVDSTIYMRNTEGHDNDPAHDISHAWYLLQDINELAHKIKPSAIMIAEDCANSAYLTKPRSENGCGFDAQWELGFPHALRDALGLRGGRTLAGVRYELERRYNGAAFEKVVFSDSHDTAANGSVRLNEAASSGDAADIHAREKSLLADAVMLTAPGIPMLLQGQEFLQEGSFNDWQELEWGKAERYSGIVLAHRHLIDLRLNRHNNTAGLLGQSTAVFHQDDNNGVLGYHRWNQGGAGDDVLIIVNFGDQAHNIYQLQLPVHGTWQVRFNSTWKGYSPDFHEVDVASIMTEGSNLATISLPPYCVLILSQDE
ncbi:alpha amylase C-terminal domain-containing protein [Candidatus Saccharibacteria bacterium]|nr:MAG: alpha amylase C-terminal domain-containing protein [Candidatus Saccharibacteria bacterium]